MQHLEVRSILIVEDDTDLASVLEDTLSVTGVKVTTTSNGKLAIGELKASKFDAVLTDYSMPDMNGIQLLAEMKDLDLDIPVIILTGHHDVNIALEALRLGAIDFLHKPAKIKDIQVAAERSMDIGVRRRRLNKEYDTLLSHLNERDASKLIEIRRQSRMLSLLQLTTWFNKSANR